MIRRRSHWIIEERKNNRLNCIKRQLHIIVVEIEIIRNNHPRAEKKERERTIRGEINVPKTLTLFI